MEIRLWRSTSFTSLVHCNPHETEIYQGDVYLNYRQLLLDNETIALLDDNGFWRSEKTGQLYSDINFTCR